MTRSWIWMLGLLLLCAAAPAGYRNDFQNVPEGAPPGDLLVLTGDFAVKKEGENAFLELPGEPLESCGVLVGPESDNGACGARIQGTVTGKRSPEFGVAVGGASGYKLWLMPAIDELQILKGDDVLAKMPYRWTSGTWTVFRVRIRKAEQGWRVEGKAWEDGKAEPQEWMIGWDEKEEPNTGRASIWGVPYSGTPIRFDDVVVGPAENGG